MGNAFSGFGVSEGVLAGLSEGERREALRELELLAELRERNPLAFVRVYAKQERFLGSRAFRKAFFGGNGAGKTHVGVIDDLIQLVDGEVLPPHLRRFKRWDPPFFLRVVVPKFGAPLEAVLDKFRELAPRDQLVGDGFDAAFSKQDRVLRFKNGSRVLFNTSDQDVDAHAGVRLHRVHFDEEPEGEHGRQVYAENVMRLRDFMPEAQVMFTMTPLFGLSWTYDELWERRGRETDLEGVYDGSDGCFVVVASLLDNPFVDGEALVRQMDHLTEEERAARIDGRFVHFHGLVLGRWDPARNVCDPPSREHVRGLETEVWIDPGVARGGGVWVGFDRDNHMLVYDELYPSGWTVPQVVAAIREKNRWWGVEPVLYGIDPSARNRVLTSAESVESLFAREGIFCVHGQNDRLAGVLQLRQRVEAGALVVSRECVNVLRERERWLVAEDEESGKGASAGFKTKGPDHLWDPIRYAAMNRLWSPPAAEPAGGVPVWRPGWAGPWRGEPLVVSEPPPMGFMS